MDLGWVAERAQVLGLVLARIAGMISLSPVLGSPQVPVLARGALALVLSLLVLPAVASPPTLSPAAYLLALAVEAATGAAAGLLAQLLFLAVQAAGELMDLDAGFGVAAVLAPELGRPAGLLGSLLHVLALWVFLAAGGLHAVLRALLESFAVMPPGWPSLPPARALELAEALGWTVVTALRLAAPLLGVLLLVTAALAVVGRVLPQLNVFFAGLPVKTAVALLALSSLLPLLVRVLAMLAGESLVPALRWLGGGGP